MFEEEKKIFHDLWSENMDRPLYHKKHWGMLNTFFESALRARNKEMLDFVLLLATLYTKFVDEVAKAEH